MLPKIDEYQYMSAVIGTDVHYRITEIIHRSPEHIHVSVH